MTDQPYTDEDLRAEAARQHAELTTDPDFIGISEAMFDRTLNSDGERTWGQIDPDEYGTVHHKIDDLIGGAANVSAWAVELGADGLQPSNEHVITINGDGAPIARVHFAFEPDMPGDMRTALVEGIGDAIAAHL